MGITPMSIDLNIVSALADKPNATNGLTAGQLKAKFDQGPNALKEYINNTLLQTVNGIIDSGVLASSDTTLTLTNSETWYKVPLNLKSNDTLSEFNTSNYRFTASKAGVYLLIASIEITNMVSGDRIFMGYFKNGSFQGYVGDIQYSGVASIMGRGSDLLVLNTSDYVELHLFSFGGGKTTNNNPTTVTFRVKRIA